MQILLELGLVGLRQRKLALMEEEGLLLEVVKPSYYLWVLVLYPFVYCLVGLRHHCFDVRIKDEIKVRQLTCRFASHRAVEEGLVKAGSSVERDEDGFHKRKGGSESLQVFDLRIEVEILLLKVCLVEGMKQSDRIP